ncbi:ATP synthase subunit s, mitochondrial [Drosophila hydei]|uniref:ATP synthase subunit s, mitochondrial n=1 Tax=Drosophila hydei TaxID=7224 RepID=A0A6J1LXT3_DROHY|nr:ATP synthase subunit s, mitochondrial [Drosophila hydei]XP_023168832.1 ATP synthase subunit s, mitochondrial [Drosophila hydei]
MSILHTITKFLSKRLLTQGTGNGIKQNYLHIGTKPHTKTRTSIKISAVRSIWGYVAVAFNQVDKDRLRRVGPNRLCAEWILKNGGGVRMTENPTKLWKEYNHLPAENTPFRIKVVDATNSSIMKIGLHHFEGCRNIDTVIFHKCKHLENDGLEGLAYLSQSLANLQVSGCYNIRDSGLAFISHLRNLKQLLIFDMPYVQNMDEVANKLKKSLPECDVQANKFGVQFKK